MLGFYFFAVYLFYNIQIVTAIKYMKMEGLICDLIKIIYLYIHLPQKFLSGLEMQQIHIFQNHLVHSHVLKYVYLYKEKYQLQTKVFNPSFSPTEILKCVYEVLRRGEKMEDVQQTTIMWKRYLVQFPLGALWHIYLEIYKQTTTYLSQLASDSSKLNLLLLFFLSTLRNSCTYVHTCIMVYKLLWLLNKTTAAISPNN